MAVFASKSPLPIMLTPFSLGDVTRTVYLPRAILISSPASVLNPPFSRVITKVLPFTSTFTPFIASLVATSSTLYLSPCLYSTSPLPLMSIALKSVHLRVLVITFPSSSILLTLDEHATRANVASASVAKRVFFITYILCMMCVCYLFYPFILCCITALKKSSRLRFVSSLSPRGAMTALP